MAQAAREKDNYSSAFKSFTLTREGKEPAWMRELRESGWQSFQALDFPTTRDEEWKYTNVAPILKAPFRQLFDPDVSGLSAKRIENLTFSESDGSRIVFVNGHLAQDLSDMGQLPAGLVVAGFSENLEAEALREGLGKTVDYRGAIFAALNTALAGDGALVSIPRGLVVENPIQILFLSTATEPVVSYPRLLIHAGEDSVATVVESYGTVFSDLYFTNAVTEIAVERGASLDHYRLQQESDHAYHIGTTRVRQGHGSRYSSLAISLGAELARHTLDISLEDRRTETVIDGLYVATGRQHVDNHTSIDHAHPDCQSSQLYKGILDGKGRAVFNGKVFVGEGALHTDARQLNKNLLLSASATVDTKPQLEILADDVKCSHGATVGQLEEDELFYLASRGISPERARALLTYGFAEDVISRIKVKSVREQLDRAVLDKLHQSLEVE